MPYTEARAGLPLLWPACGCHQRNPPPTFLAQQMHACTCHRLPAQGAPEHIPHIPHHVRRYFIVTESQYPYSYATQYQGRTGSCNAGYLNGLPRSRLSGSGYYKYSWLSASTMMQVRGALAGEGEGEHMLQS